MRFCFFVILSLATTGIGCARINPFKKPVAPDQLIPEDHGYGHREGKGIFQGVSNSSLRTNVRTALGKGPSRDAARKFFALGDEKYREASAMTAEDQRGPRRKKFLAAAEHYTEAGMRWPNSSMEENSLFMTADSLFFADHYEDANEKFEELLEKFPNSRHLDRAEARRFAIAQYWEKLVDTEPEPIYYLNFTREERPVRDATGHALRIYDKIRVDDPTGDLADDATMAAANVHFKKEKYILADEYYTDLRRAFPNSEHQFMAHFLGLRAKLASYQGVDYSGTVLKQGEELIKAMRTHFPSESRQHAEYLDRAAAEVAYLQAERDWSNGRYYDRRSEFGAAKFHYAKLLDRYPNTPFAEKARARIGEIHGLPEVPDQKLEWLVDLFPGLEEPTLRPIQSNLEGVESGRNGSVIAQGGAGPTVNR